MSKPLAVMEKNDVQRVYQTLNPNFPKFDFDLNSEQGLNFCRPVMVITAFGK